MSASSFYTWQTLSYGALNLHLVWCMETWGTQHYSSLFLIMRASNAVHFKSCQTCIKSSLINGLMIDVYYYVACVRFSCMLFCAKTYCLHVWYCCGFKLQLEFKELKDLFIKNFFIQSIYICSLSRFYKGGVKFDLMYQYSW